ncbi:hypothetical protein [Antarcticimicrobium luteum]|uniref:hypothetical protein n=1 Tax=Antarcticimicrobium luteum TaxID=2547397 RepID=UPI0014081777|nr:hypothetical protein [Antarcticimicrobium luteum]
MPRYLYRQVKVAVMMAMEWALSEITIQYQRGGQFQGQIGFAHFAPMSRGQ